MTTVTASSVQRLGGVQGADASCASAGTTAKPVSFIPALHSVSVSKRCSKQSICRAAVVATPVATPAAADTAQPFGVFRLAYDTLNVSFSSP